MRYRMKSAARHVSDAFVIAFPVLAVVSMAAVMWDVVWDAAPLFGVKAFAIF